LSDFAEIKKDGRPVIQQIKHARIWLTGIGDAVSPQRKRIEIAEMKVVGNRWEKDGIRTLGDVRVGESDPLFILWDPDPTVALGVISNKTDPEYRPPSQPNVQNEIAEKEQSLLVKYDNIPNGAGFRVLKRFAGVGLDLSTTYKDLAFFVHTDQLDPDMEYFFRLGFDSLAYYEVNVPLTSVFFSGDNWARVVIDLNSLSSLKLLPADTVVAGAPVVADSVRDIANPDLVYKIRMVGTPSLFNVRFLYAGLRNKSDRYVSGELWINDIYLGNRRRDVDLAYRLTGSVSMGNVLSLSGSWTRTGPDYVPFGQKRGPGTDTRSVSLSAKTNVEYFIPLFGFSVPVTGNYSRSTNLPKYMPNSDTEITGTAVQDSMKSVTMTRGFGTTLTRSGSKNPLLAYTFDKLKANYSLSQSRLQSPSAADTTLTMGGTLDYSLTFAGKHRLRLFKNFGVRYWPNAFNFRVNAMRSAGTRYRNVGGALVADPPLWNAAMSNFGSITYIPLPSLTSSFRMQTERDLKLPHEWFGVDIGLEVNRNHSFQANYKPPPVWIIRAFSPDFNYNTGYREDSSPNVRKPGDPYGVRNVSASRDMSLKLGFDLGRYLGRAFGAAGLLEEKTKGSQGSRGRPGSGERGVGEGGSVGEGEGERSSEGTREEGGPPGNADSTAARPKGGRPGNADSTAAQPKRKTDPMIAVRKVADVLSSIRKVNASFQQGRQNTYSRIPGAPSLAYQFGLTSASGVVYKDTKEDTVLAYDQPDQVSENLRMSMDSGVQLTRNIDVAGRFSRTMGTNTFRASETQSRSTTWPDLSVSWKGLETFGLFRGLFNNASATMTYNKSRQETGRSGTTETKRESSNLTPSVVFQWKNDIRSSVGIQYGKDLTDTRGSVTENSNLSISMDMKYTFSPGKSLKIPLPFLRNRSLKSRLDTSVGAGYSRSGGRRSAGAPGRFVTVPGSSSIRLSPRVAYNFTSAFNGSLFIDYTRSHSDASDKTITIVRVGLTATFTF
jgi:cell surface protein SprA